MCFVNNGLADKTSTEHGLVMLWNDEVCDNGNAMKQYNFQNNYGVIA